jgi:uncharacterized protein (DUF2235 family)
MSSEALPRPGKRLALFFDGTWNKPENNTNVWRLHLMLADKSDDGVPQLKFYDEGLGTKWFDRLTGGAFGYGLSENVQAGYRWLMEYYEPGDEIYVFGFSRGAFTARSLAGFIARCGLLKPDAPISFAQLYDRYRKGDTVRPIYRLKYLQRTGEKNFDFEEQTLLKHSYYQRNFIKMVGVWDTVGTLGIPFGRLPGISRKTLGFHNTHLSKIVQHSYQALALDEFRKPYWAILWTNFTPATPNEADAPQVDNRHVEQRWFAGSHCNVGGGYRNDLLPQRPLAWIQEKANHCGLAFRSHVVVSDDDLEMSACDSYGQFLGGLWRVITFGKRYVRWVMSDPKPKAAHWKGKTRIDDGWVETVNERIDLSVFRRCKLDKHYLPASLVEWAQRKSVDLDAVVNAPEKFPQYWSPLLQAGLESSVERSLSPPESLPGTEPRQVLPSPSEGPRLLKP